MLRRNFSVVSASSSASFIPKQTSAARTYFMPGAMEVGITGATQYKILITLMWLGGFFCPIFIYKFAMKPWTPDKQFICMSTDKWYSDGTEMKGEEATANLRLQRERIMPIMDAYLEKIEKAAAAQ